MVHRLYAYTPEITMEIKELIKETYSRCCMSQGPPSIFEIQDNLMDIMEELYIYTIDGGDRVFDRYEFKNSLGIILDEMKCIFKDERGFIHNDCRVVMWKEMLFNDTRHSGYDPCMLS